MSEQTEKTETAGTGAIRSKLYEMGYRFELRFDLMLDNDVAMRRIAEVFGEGFRKYPFRNWKKGFPESVYINHAFEHLRMYLTGDTSEDHLAHATWNLMSLMWLQEKKPELLDLTNSPWPPPPPAPMTICEVTIPQEIPRHYYIPEPFAIVADNHRCMDCGRLPDDECHIREEAEHYSVHFFPVAPVWQERSLDNVWSWSGPGWYIVESSPFANLMGDIPYATRREALNYAAPTLFHYAEPPTPEKEEPMRLVTETVKFPNSPIHPGLYDVKLHDITTGDDGMPVIVIRKK